MRGGTSQLEVCVTVECNAGDASNDERRGTYSGLPWWHQRTVAAWHHGTVASRHHGTVAPRHKGTMAPRHQGAVAPWHRRAVAPWHRGTMAPWHHGTKASRHQGTNAPWQNQKSVNLRSIIPVFFRRSSIFPTAAFSFFYISALIFYFKYISMLPHTSWRFS